MRLTVTVRANGSRLYRAPSAPLRQPRESGSFSTLRSNSDAPGPGDRRNLKSRRHGAAAIMELTLMGDKKGKPAKPSKPGGKSDTK